MRYYGGDRGDGEDCASVSWKVWEMVCGRVEGEGCVRTQEGVRGVATPALSPITRACGRELRDEAGRDGGWGEEAGI